MMYRLELECFLYAPLYTLAFGRILAVSHLSAHIFQQSSHTIVVVSLAGIESCVIFSRYFPL